jgi:hypothetical protein
VPCTPGLISSNAGKTGGTNLLEFQSYDSSAPNLDLLNTFIQAGYRLWSKARPSRQVPGPHGAGPCAGHIRSKPSEPRAGDMKRPVRRRRVEHALGRTGGGAAVVRPEARSVPSVYDSDGMEREDVKWTV